MDVRETSDRACVAFGQLLPARFAKRQNRFRVDVWVEGEQVAAHLANPGRLEELLIPGCAVWLRPASSPHRKTAYTLALVEAEGHLISMNSHLPNRLVDQALNKGLIKGLDPFRHVQREVPRGRSRLDFRIADDNDRAYWVEVKSVTLVEAGEARFPDAPTARGRRHLQELITVIESGERAAVIFVVQRPDATHFAPNDATDPDFSAALRNAAQAGVNVRALRCNVTRERICLLDEIPVSLDAPNAAAIIPPEPAS